MSKHIDDIIPPERRSIRKVNMSRTPRHRTHDDISETKEHHRENEPVRVRRSSSRATRFGLWLVAGISVLVLIFGFSILFSGAKVVVVPKQRTVLVDSSFQAFRHPGVRELGYEIMTIEKEFSRDVTASGEEFVEEKASGKIIIYNNFNSSSQRLIKNTRFETPDGLIYRINESVVIPGQKTEEGKVVPGSIEVVVYADEAGEKYNIGVTDFTIPGFKGDPRFDDFYARSQTIMSGGFVGEKKVISKEDESATRTLLQGELRQQLLKESSTQKPDGFELYGEGVFVTFDSLPSIEQGGKVSVREKATLYGVLFKREAFARFLASNTVAGFNEEDSIEILEPNSLSFTLNDKETVKPWEDDAITFTLKGNAHLVWTFDSNQLKEDLSGKAKGALETVLTGYPSIDEARIVLRPFWKQTFPDNIKDIKVTTIIEN